MSHSTKRRPSSGATSRPFTISTSLSLRSNSSSTKNPTQPPRHSLRPMSTDTLAAANSVHAASYTKPGWQTTTEPGFITSLGQNEIQAAAKPGTQWQATTEPGFVTRFKLKPSSNKPKSTKKPIQSTTNKNNTTKHGNKVSRPSTTTLRYYIIM